MKIWYEHIPLFRVVNFYQLHDGETLIESWEFIAKVEYEKNISIGDYHIRKIAIAIWQVLLDGYLQWEEISIKKLPTIDIRKYEN